MKKNQDKKKKAIEPKTNFFLRPDETGWDNLKKNLDYVADTAEARGLTPEKLEKIIC